MTAHYFEMQLCTFSGEGGWRSAWVAWNILHQFVNECMFDLIRWVAWRSQSSLNWTKQSTVIIELYTDVIHCTLPSLNEGQLFSRRCWKHYSLKLTTGLISVCLGTSRKTFVATRGIYPHRRLGGKPVGQWLSIGCVLQPYSMWGDVESTRPKVGGCHVLLCLCDSIMVIIPTHWCFAILT